jgi:predicted Zn-dependent protease with MMP-like domain
MADDPDHDLIEAIYDALDGNDPDRALELAREGLRSDGADDPVLHFLTGVALLDLDRPDKAAESFGRAAELDPDDAEFRADLALALHRSCRFDDAEREAEAALAVDRDSPDAHHVRALLLERRGDLAGADRHFARAAKLDPERFPLAVRLDRAAFEERVAAARAKLPPDFARHLDGIAVIVDDVPPEDVLTAESPYLDPDLLGLFRGVPLEGKWSFGAGGELPPTIHLFRRNIERFAEDEDDLTEQITITLYHELGHYLGMEEEDLEELDFG